MYLDIDLQGESENVGKTVCCYRTIRAIVIIECMVEAQTVKSSKIIFTVKSKKLTQEWEMILQKTFYEWKFN